MLSAALQIDEAAAVMTQLPPEQAFPLMASMASGDDLGEFSIQAFDGCGARAGSCKSLECTLNVTCEGLEPPKAAFPINAAGVAVATGKR